MDRILIIEDNRAIAETVREHLVAEGYQALVADTAAGGLAAIREQRPRVVILDLMLPDDSGESVLARMRAARSPALVLILSAKSDEMSKVEGFRVGADDYLTKPFGILELIARVENLVRRSRTSHCPEEPFRFADVVVDPAAHRVTKGGRPVELRPKEYDLLVALLSRSGQVWRRRDLLDAVWGYDPSVESRTVDWHVAELRRKLGLDSLPARYLQTVRKTGYRFELQDG